MARARNIKPGFFRNADLVELSFEARLLFIGLWTIADREGRMEDRPKQIKMELFPADNLDCDDLLNQLQSIGLIDRYLHGGKRYLHIVNFKKHQNPHKDEKASTIPDKHGSSASTVQAPCKGGDCSTIEHGEEHDEHDASTVQAPCNNDAPSEPILLNPDPRSLIADTGFPDSHTACASACDSKPSPGDVCKAMKQMELGGVNPGNQLLKTLIDVGATLDEFKGAAAKAAEGKKGFAYALGIVKNEREQAAQIAAGLVRGPLPNKSRAPAAENFETKTYAGGLL